MTITNWDTIENFTNAPDISFACLVTVNLHYSLFRKLVKGFSPFSISNIPENSIVGIYYRQYDELVAGFYLTSDCDYYKEDAFNLDKNNDARVVEDRIVENYDNQGKNNNQNSDKAYMGE